MIKRLQREAQFPCVGKLRKGGVKEKKTITKNGQSKEIETYGKDLTYFRFDTDDQRAAAHFHAAYGEQPSVINVYLPHQTAEQNFSCWQEAYLAGGLTHRCDGETCVIWLDNGKYRTDPKPCPGGCKEVGRLMVIVPELQRFAYVAVETHSVHDIIRLQENLQAVEFLRGDLRGIPFILKRTPVEISTPTGDGKRARREKWLLSIEVDPAWAALQLESMHRAALTVSGITIDDSRLLTTAIVEDEDEIDGEIIAPSATIQRKKPIDTEASENVKEFQQLLKQNGLPPSESFDAIPSATETDSAVAEEATKIAVGLASPPAAQAWAVENHYCSNEFHARNRWQNIVKDKFNNKVTGANVKAAIIAYVVDCLSKPVVEAEKVEA